MLKKLKSYLSNYMSRHRSRVDVVLHIIGIPLAVFGAFQLIIGQWQGGLCKLFVGYLLQWIGHRYFDHNEVGEWTLIKYIIKKLRGH